MYLPLMFKGAGMRCLIIGGGEVALRKLEMLMAADCAVTIIAPSIHGGIRSAVEAGQLRWLAREFRSGDCSGYQLVIAATGRREINKIIFEESASLCVPVNVVDDPELCTIVFPAVWRKGPLTVSVSTDGTAPFMAAAVRDRLATHAEPLVAWVEAAAKFRAVVRSGAGSQEEKDLLYRRFVDRIQSGAPPDFPESEKISDWVAWLESIKGTSR
jgi:uroporphyrin-III C-methyltransferase / precorrin-2 dehydrogenase / sirohydrochlorin ferrochelatase